MKNLFAGSLLVFLIAYGFDTGQCFQKRRPVAKKTAKSELSSQNKRSTRSTAKPAPSADAKVSAVIDDFDSFTAELVGKVEKARNPTLGINAAQRHMNLRKAGMKARFATVRCVPEAEVSEATKTKVKEHLYNDGFRIGQLLPKYGSTPALKAKIQKLIDDYLEIFKLEGPCPKDSLAALS